VILVSSFLRIRTEHFQNRELSERLYEESLQYEMLGQEAPCDGENLYLSKPANLTENQSIARSDTGEKTETEMTREGYESGMMHIVIPAIHVTAGIGDGTERETLKGGPGLYECSSLPDEAVGNVCIAGHRTTYGAWFRHLDLLKKGDKIYLFFNGNTYIYEVEKVFVVDKCDWSITEKTDARILTLSACHPIGSAKERIVVRADLAAQEEICFERP